MKTIIKWATILICWLTISPILYLLSRKWALMPKWVSLILILVSPLVLIFFFVSGIILYMKYDKYQENIQFSTPSKIEKVTALLLPCFDIKDGIDGSTALQGDYRNQRLIVLKGIPDVDFYEKLDKLCKDDKYWSRIIEGKDTVYRYDRIWGSDLEIPDGVRSKNGFLKFDIKKNIKEIELIYGSL